MPNLKTGNTPLNVFAGSNLATNPKHWYPLGCPVYVLNNSLQAGKKTDKWSDRSRVGIYLGPLPQHARTVALVLSMTTGLVSPQFHVRMDPTFQTHKTIFGGNPPNSQWQNKCHFIQDDETSKNMRLQKRSISTREVYKWKARLNIDGSTQIKGVNYWESYAPVASWPTIRLTLTMAIVKGWHTRQIDYVLAYTQADAETDNT
jgi:hypothetical protein